MSDFTLYEADYLAAIKAAMTIDALSEVMDCLVGLAKCYIKEGLTQEAADVLAFVLLRSESDADTHETAHDLFDELESRICPRVILDAREFAQEVTLKEMIDYVFAEGLDD